MFCGKCGTKLEDSTIFCTHCGVKTIGSKEIPKEIPKERKQEVPAIPKERNFGSIVSGVLTIILGTTASTLVLSTLIPFPYGLTLALIVDGVLIVCGVKLILRGIKKK